MWTFSWTWGATFSVPSFWLGPLDSLTKMVTGVDGKPQSKIFTKPLHCKVGNWQGAHPFLYIPSCPASLQGRDLLCLLQTRVTWGKLETDSFLRLVSEYMPSDIEKEESFPFSDEIIPQVWDASSPGLVIHVPPVKILLRSNTPYPWKRQDPLKPEALGGLRPLVKKYRNTGILITCESPCNTLILPVKKPMDLINWSRI